MNGEIAQLIALTCHANAFLRGVDVTDFFPNNSTCKYCDSVEFYTVDKNWFGQHKEKLVASSPQEWFIELKHRGVTGIRIRQSLRNNPKISDRMSAGFVGGGAVWMMESLLPKNQSEMWVSRWMVWNQEAPENRIWRVSYGRVVQGVIERQPDPDQLAISNELEQALREILLFAKKNDCEYFDDKFADALNVMAKTAELQGYHQDLAPEGMLPVSAKIILNACQIAWVFGGMGSWNDLGFGTEGERNLEYHRVSERLFQAIHNAIVMATNLSCSTIQQGKKSV